MDARNCLKEKSSVLDIESLFCVMNPLQGDKNCNKQFVSLKREMDHPMNEKNRQHQHT